MKIYRQEIHFDINVFPPFSSEQLGKYGETIELPYKGKAAILVEHEEDIRACEKIIKDMDPLEYKDYCPNGLVQQLSSVFPSGDHTIYTGKFCMDITRFLKEAQKAGIRCFVQIAEPCSCCGTF